MELRDWPTKKPGDQDQVVRTIQHLLNSRGEDVAPDGVFDDRTQACVASFQKANGLAEDGIVGGDTWEALIVDLELGARGDAVKAAQTQLYIRGTLPEVDGVYSMKMNISVRRLQVLKHLDPHGVVDKATWNAMVSDTDLPAVSRDLSRDSFDWQAKLRSMLRPEG
jgi:peptidoglycan hydrolase-like protein with peptidoglycan-binding domain